MSRAVKTLFGIGVGMMVLSGPAFLLGIYMAYYGILDFSPELDFAEYFNLQLAKWVAPPLIMFVVGVHLVVVGLIVWYYQRRRRPTTKA